MDPALVFRVFLQTYRRNGGSGVEGVPVHENPKFLEVCLAAELVLGGGIAGLPEMFTHVLTSEREWPRNLVTLCRTAVVVQVIHRRNDQRDRYYVNGQTDAKAYGGSVFGCRDPKSPDRFIR